MLKKQTIFLFVVLLLTGATITTKCDGYCVNRCNDFFDDKIRSKCLKKCVNCATAKQCISICHQMIVGAPKKMCIDRCNEAFEQEWEIPCKKVSGFTISCETSKCTSCNTRCLKHCEGFVDSSLKNKCFKRCRIRCSDEFLEICGADCNKLFRPTQYRNKCHRRCASAIIEWPIYEPCKVSEDGNNNSDCKKCKETREKCQKQCGRDKDCKDECSKCKKACPNGIGPYKPNSGGGRKKAKCKKCKAKRKECKRKCGSNRSCKRKCKKCSKKICKKKNKRYSRKCKKCKAKRKKCKRKCGRNRKCKRKCKKCSKRVCKKKRKRYSRKCKRCKAKRKKCKRKCGRNRKCKRKCKKCSKRVCKKKKNKNRKCTKCRKSLRICRRRCRRKRSCRKKCGKCTKKCSRKKRKRLNSVKKQYISQLFDMGWLKKSKAILNKAKVDHGKHLLFKSHKTSGSYFLKHYPNFKSLTEDFKSVVETIHTLSKSEPKQLQSILTVVNRDSEIHKSYPHKTVDADKLREMIKFMKHLAYISADDELAIWLNTFRR